MTASDEVDAFPTPQWRCVSALVMQDLNKQHVAASMR